jgi:hypothetical protein
MIAQRIARSDEVAHLACLRYLTVALDYLRTLPQQIQCQDQRRPAIHPTPLGIKIDEFHRFTRIFRDRLQLPVLDNLRTKAFLVLDLHAVEDTAI